MNRLPVELKEIIIQYFGYMELKYFALSSDENMAIAKKHIYRIYQKLMVPGLGLGLGQMDIVQLYMLYGGIATQTNYMGTSIKTVSGQELTVDTQCRSYYGFHVAHPHKRQFLNYRWRNQEGLHRDDGPALTYKVDGQVVEQAYYINGKHHRDFGPAVTEWYANGALKSQRWYKHGILEREVDWTQDGIKRLETWSKNGKYHKTDGPAYIRWFDGDHSIQYECYYQHGIRHREDGPAEVSWNDTPRFKLYEGWYRNGKLHRRTGYAQIISSLQKNGYVHETKTWYYNGVAGRQSKRTFKV